ncbi:hypothetical protein F5H01DRAFT_189859 [Linnemannia elongata]|nr:hypothetical protein F5H01DRAFT_189859 [Linnemannia elongata]
MPFSWTGVVMERLIRLYSLSSRPIHIFFLSAFGLTLPLRTCPLLLFFFFFKPLHASWTPRNLVCSHCNRFSQWLCCHLSCTRCLIPLVANIEENCWRLRLLGT